jgi:hypothetical protein
VISIAVALEEIDEKQDDFGGAASVAGGTLGGANSSTRQVQVVQRYLNRDLK